MNNLQSVAENSNYQILKLVGQGQFGRVFCAAHRQTEELVALKYLDQRFPTRRFLKELDFSVSLDHPNIVNCQALEHNQSGRYLVMDYCEGGSLRDLIEAEPLEVPAAASSKLNLTQSLKLVEDILVGLEYIHSRQVIHCDLKPENILLTLEPTGWKARISDFGAARLSTEAEAAPLSDTGSPAYMAPERFYGHYSFASDLYAVGIILYELVVGERPFSGPLGEIMYAHLNEPVEIPDTVPFCVRSPISKAVQKLPTHRFASATEMLKAVRLAAAISAATNQISS